MKKLPLSCVSLLVWSCSPFATVAQTGPALLRMERVQVGEAVCVLVQDDGTYRLEKLFRAKTEMFTGSLDAARVEQLRAMLANEPLRKLSQENVRKPLITDAIDDLQFAIWRTEGWQELTFSTPDSRKPYKEALDPLLHWFQDLQKHPPAAARVEGSQTRCQPTHVTKLTTTIGNPLTSGPAPASNTAAYLFRFNSIHYYRARVDGACTIVFCDGSYHGERSDQTYLGHRRDKIVDGRLEPEAIEKLKTVLGSRELESDPSTPDDWNPQLMREGSVTVLSVPRQREVQRLVFSDAFNTKGNWREIGGLSNMQYRVSDKKHLGPLIAWMKLYTDKHGNAVEQEAAGNDCLRSTASVSGKSSAQ